MGNRKSLGRIIAKYALLELIYTFSLILILFLFFNQLINIGLVYPANYAEKGLEQVEEQFQEPDWNVHQLPYYYEYWYKDGDQVQSNIDNKYKDLIKESLDEGQSISNHIMDSKVFVHFKEGNKDLVVSYRLSAILAKEDLFEYIQNFEQVYVLFFLFIWSLGFSLLVRRTIKIIDFEMKKISKTNAYIHNFDLDYPREESSYLEVSNVLSSLDSMALGLKDALHKQWKIQEEQKEMMEHVTHDIRTPITLIKGNLDLLKEESSIEFHEDLEDIERGVKRLEVYVDELSNYRRNFSKKREEAIDQEVLEGWISLAQSICKNNKRYLEVEQRDPSQVRFNRENMEVILENLLTNSIEHSQEHSRIRLYFIDKNKHYRIIVKDEGTGFDSAILTRATDKYVSSKVNDDRKHGMGLYIVQEIVKKAGGVLLINNYQDSNTSGARVEVCIKKK